MRIINALWGPRGPFGTRRRLIISASVMVVGSSIAVGLIESAEHGLRTLVLMTAGVLLIDVVFYFIERALNRRDERVAAELLARRDASAVGDEVAE